MYVDNQAKPPHSDPSDGFYTPEEDDPPDGSCGSVGRYAKTIFTLTGGSDVEATYGITLCPNLFRLPMTSRLRPPVPNGGEAQIERFRETGGMLILHDFVHLVTYNSKKHLLVTYERRTHVDLGPVEIIDQPAAYPPDGKTWTNKNWASWVLNPKVFTYGYTPSAYLGLSMPELAMKNADNFMVLALCLQYAALDCLGKFQNDIQTKRNVPFHVSSRTVQRIRSGELDLRKDGIPTNTSEGVGSLVENELEGAGSLGPEYSIGHNAQLPGRFKDG